MHFLGVPSDQEHLLLTESEAYRALRAAGEARHMLEAGVTAARCLGSSISPALRRGINEGHVPGPRLVAAGKFVCSTGGTWDHISVPLDQVKADGMLADGVDGLREAVRTRVREGSTVIKLGLSKGRVDDLYHVWGDDPYRQIASYQVDEIRSATNEAHANGLMVSAHCIGDEAVRNALDGGVDVIEHGYAISEGTRKRLVDRDILVVTTLSQLFYHRLAADPYHYPPWKRAMFTRHEDAMRDAFQKSLSAGVRYALGTDLVGHPTHPLDLVATEFRLAVELGMSTHEAINAGTARSAAALGMADSIGTLKPGKLADIIAVPGDPASDISVLSDVRFVMQGGQVVVDKRPHKPHDATA
jgi:imidazolonepropionase-like amidohydrolase